MPRIEIESDINNFNKKYLVSVALMKISINKLRLGILFMFFLVSEINFGQQLSYFKLNDTSLDSPNYSVFRDKKIKFYLIGETHSYKGNGEIEMQFFKILKNNSEKLNLLVEVPPSLKQCFEKYLFGGDTLEFVQLSQALRNPYEDTFFYRELRSYFKEYGHDKFNICMVDIEQNLNLTFYRLKQLFLIDSLPPTPISKIINDIKEIETPSNIGYLSKSQYKKLVKYSIELDNIHNQNKHLFQRYLGSSYSEFFEIEKSLMIGIKTKPIKNNISSKFQNIREEAMYNNTVSFINQHKDETFLGVFGAYHTVLNPTFIPTQLKQKKSLGYFLNENENSPVYKSVSSILIVYPNQIVKQANFQIISENDLNRFRELNTEIISIINTEDPANKTLNYITPYFNYIVINKY